MRASRPREYTLGLFAQVGTSSFLPYKLAQRNKRRKGSSLIEDTELSAQILAKCKHILQVHGL